MTSTTGVSIELDARQIPALKRAIAHYLCLHRDPDLARALEQLERFDHDHP